MDLRSSARAPTQKEPKQSYEKSAVTEQHKRRKTDKRILGSFAVSNQAVEAGQFVGH